MDNPIETTQLLDLLKISTTTLKTWKKEGLPYLDYGKAHAFIWDDVLSWVLENKGRNYRSEPVDEQL